MSSIKTQLKDKFVDLLALFVAIVALVFSVIQGKTQSDLTIAQWQPRLLIEFIKANNQPKKGFLLRNVGLGPALIKSFRYCKNEQDFKKNVWHQEWLHPDGYSKAVLLGFQFEDINYLTNGYAIPNEQKEDLFLLGTTAKDFYNSSTAYSMDSVIIEIEYTAMEGMGDKTYFLRYCELFRNNNMHKRNDKILYEKQGNSTTR